MTAYPFIDQRRRQTIGFYCLPLVLALLWFFYHCVVSYDELVSSESVDDVTFKNKKITHAVSSLGREHDNNISQSSNLPSPTSTAQNPIPKYENKQEDILTMSSAPDSVSLSNEPDPSPIPTSTPSAMPLPNAFIDADSETSREALRKLQLENYRNGSGLIVNIHVTHHGGTALCNVIGHAENVPTLEGYQSTVPDFNCMGDRANISRGIYQYTPQTVPWQGENETSDWISKIRPFFHMISWEFREAPKRGLHLTDWENPRLVSIMVVRHPIGRMLAGDGLVGIEYPGGLETEPNQTLRHEYWWDYVNGTNVFAKTNTNNYALRVLSSNECCDGTESDIRSFEQARALLKRFTVILDIDCLNEGLSELGKILNITLDCNTALTCSKAVQTVAARPSYADRIGFDDVYQFLLEKNKYDIELYEWAKQRSLIKCNAGNDAAPPQIDPPSSTEASLQTLRPSLTPGQRQALKVVQIDNYRKGTALMLNLHLTHHGGTAFCQTVGRAQNIPGGGTTPSFVCMGDNDNVTKGVYIFDNKVAPWEGLSETESWIKKTRPFFHMISWEYGDISPKRNLTLVDWENQNLLSVIIIRHPIDRILAADANIQKRYPGLDSKDTHHEYETNKTVRHQYWWDYANGTSVMSTRNSNNFALRILSNPTECCDGSHTDRKYLHQAQSLLQRFTVILDQACLNDGMEALGQMLNLTLSWKTTKGIRDGNISSDDKSYRDRIGFDDVYEFLLEKNKLDIELYEWAKQRSFHSCSRR